MSTTETHRNLRTATGTKVHAGIAPGDHNLPTDRTLCGTAITYKLTACAPATLDQVHAHTTCTKCAERTAWLIERRANA